MAGPSAATVSVVDSGDGACPEIKVVVGTGNAKVVMWPGVGAQHRTMHLIDLKEGSSTIPLQHDGESVYYVIAGVGAVVDLASEVETAVEEGSMVHIGPRDRYVFKALATGLKFVGGPCPADLGLYASLQNEQ
jgi:mannose-6-phosphate isomerase-like protein (cupin superfamily)